MSKAGFSLHHVSVLVRDTTASLHFYRDIVGMEPDPARPKLRYSGAWLRAGAGQIHLIELPNPDPVTGRPEHGGNDRHVALHIATLDPLQERLQAAGIAYSLSHSGRRALFCRDPDGNALEFIEAT